MLRSVGFRGLLDSQKQLHTIHTARHSVTITHNAWSQVCKQSEQVPHQELHLTKLPCHAGSEQHAFMLNDLASVNRTLTPWLVVGGHRPFYIDSTNNMEPDGDQPVARALREALEDAFYEFQVWLLHALQAVLCVDMNVGSLCFCEGTWRPPFNNILRLLSSGACTLYA